MTATHALFVCKSCSAALVDLCRARIAHDDVTNDTIYIKCVVA